MRHLDVVISISNLPRLIWSDGQRSYAAEPQLKSHNLLNDNNRQF